MQSHPLFGLDLRYCAPLGYGGAFAVLSRTKSEFWLSPNPKFSIIKNYKISFASLIRSALHLI